MASTTTNTNQPKPLSLRRPHVFGSSTSMRSGHSQLDEGFSETRSQSDSEMAYAQQEMDGTTAELLAKVLDLPVDMRKRMSRPLTDITHGAC